MAIHCISIVYSPKSVDGQLSQQLVDFLDGLDRGNNWRTTQHDLHKYRKRYEGWRQCEGYRTDRGGV